MLMSRAQKLREMGFGILADLHVPKQIVNRRELLPNLRNIRQNRNQHSSNVQNWINYRLRIRNRIKIAISDTNQ